MPLEITAGPDGNLWFTESGGNPNNGYVGEFDLATGDTTDFPISSDSSPVGITAGPDGNIWFTESASNANRIGQINPTTDAVMEFPIPTGNSDAVGITVGPDGNLWFTEFDANKIGQVVLSAAAPAPDLKLAGTAPSSVTLGQQVTYSLTVTNQGTAAGTGVSLTDTLPSGVTFVSATGGVAPVNGVLTFALGSLDAKADASVTIVVTPTAAGPLSDTAAASMDQTDPTPADNSVTLPTTVAAVAGTADLALSGNVPSSVTLGNTVTYTLTVTNQGTATATGVTLTDTLPSGVDFVSATGGATPTRGVLTFTLGDLAAGADSKVTIVVTPTAAGSSERRRQGQHGPDRTQPGQ